MLEVGCKPPHWKIHSNLKPCSTKEEIKRFKWPTYAALQNFSPPCQVIEKLQYEYEEFDDKYSNPEGNVSSWFGISLFFPEPSYKEIKQVQAYDLESFVGNTGGYIGLFLGYAILSLPTFLMALYRTMKNSIEDWTPKISIERHKNGRDTSPESVSALQGIPKLENEADLDIKITAIYKILTSIHERQRKLESKFTDLNRKLSEQYNDIHPSDC